MSNQLEKLKESINKEYVNLFDINLMKSSGFIPVDKRQGEFFLVVKKDLLSHKENFESIISTKIEKMSLKYIPVDSRDFSLLTDYLISFKNDNKSVSEQNEPSSEDMLVSIGWLSAEQLKECKKEAQEKQVSIDTLFFEKGLLTVDKIVSYLKKKYGNKVVLKSDIVSDESILKLLPEDFVEKKKTIIMSMEGTKLAVAMVNPDDKYTIREISLSTGRPLNVYTIPSFEFDSYLKDYMLMKQKEQHAKETERIIQSIEMEAAEYNTEETLWAQVEKELQDDSENHGGKLSFHPVLFSSFHTHADNKAFPFPKVLFPCFLNMLMPNYRRV